jgi:hypothetical protein
MKHLGMEISGKVSCKVVYFVSISFKKRLESDKLCLAIPFSFSAPGR